VGNAGRTDRDADASILFFRVIAVKRDSLRCSHCNFIMFGLKQSVKLEGYSKDKAVRGNRSRPVVR